MTIVWRTVLRNKVIQLFQVRTIVPLFHFHPKPSQIKILGFAKTSTVTSKVLLSRLCFRDEHQSSTFCSTARVKNKKISRGIMKMQGENLAIIEQTQEKILTVYLLNLLGTDFQLPSKKNLSEALQSRLK